jgi:hypothetical protein
VVQVYGGNTYIAIAKLVPQVVNHERPWSSSGRRENWECGRRTTGWFSPLQLCVKITLSRRTNSDVWWLTDSATP